MKKIILNFERKQDGFKELVQEAFNKDILNFLVSAGTYQEFEKIDRVNLYVNNLDVPANYIVCDTEEKLKEILSDKKFSEKFIGFSIELKSKENERAIVELSNTKLVDFIIVSAKDWKIIPFENLIAEMHKNDTELIAAVDSFKEAELMLKTLEIGVDGILITPKNVDEIIELKN